MACTRTTLLYAGYRQIDYGKTQENSDSLSVGMTQYEARIVTNSMANCGRLQGLNAGLGSQ